MSKKKIVAGVMVLAAVVLLAYFFLGKSGREIMDPAGQVSGLVLNEIPPALDPGVASSGFEESVALSAVNAQAELSPFQKIEGGRSLLISFSDRDPASVKLEDYVDGVFEGSFYRLSFWGKADRDRVLEISLSDGKQVQALGTFSLSGEGEARYFEALFQAQFIPTDLIVSSDSAAAGKIWLDAVWADELDLESADQLNNLQETRAGETHWKNIFYSETPDEEADSDDFFAQPGRRLGGIVQLEKGDLTGAVLKFQRQGDGGKGTYRLQIRDVAENLNIPADDPVVNVNVNLGFPAEAAKREKEMRDEFARTEKAIEEGRLNPEPPADEDSPELAEEAGPEENRETAKEKRTSLLEEQIRKMKAGYNVPEEITVPLAARLEPGRKYWIGISNEGVAMDSENFVKVFLNPEGESLTSAGGDWQTSTGGLWLQLFGPERKSADGQAIGSGAVIADLGGGTGVFRYSLKSSDNSSFSGIAGRNVLDAEPGKFGAADAAGNYYLKADGPDGAEQLVYKLDTFYPVEKIYLRNIAYRESLVLEYSADGKNWEEIISEEAPDPAKPVKIKNLVLQGDGESRQIYLRVSPQGNAAALSDIDIEAVIKL